jgi:hypothetical protein
LTVGGCRLREPSARVNDCGFFHRHKDSQTQPQSSGTALVMPNRIHPHVVNIFAALVVTVSAGAAMAGDAEPTFGSRTDKPDGSSALTVGRRLPTPWETKVGADVSLAAPSGIAASDNLVRGGVAQDRSSGAVWGNLTMPGLRPLGFDKTSVEARVDAGKDEGKLGTTLSRSVPINPELSVTLQNSYSVKQSLATTATGVPTPPTAGMPNTGAAAPAPAWGVDETVRLNVDPSGTTFSAGAGASTVDTQWHNKLSMEQTLVGPLKLTTSIEDAGTTTPKKSITAGFKRTW